MVVFKKYMRVLQCKQALYHRLLLKQIQLSINSVQENNKFQILINKVKIYNNQLVKEQMPTKVTFKVILTSEIDQPFKVISVPQQAPFSAVIRYVCSQFRVDQTTTSILTMDGVGINPDQSCGDVFLKFGSDLKMIPRDRVGCL